MDLLSVVQVVVVAVAATLTAIAATLTLLKRWFREPIEEGRLTVENAKILVNGRDEQRASWDRNEVLVPRIEPAAKRLSNIEQMLTEHSAAISAVKAELTFNGGKSTKDMVRGVHTRLDTIERGGKPDDPES